MTKSRNILGPRKPWTKQQLAKLRKLYANNSTAAVAKACGHSLSSTYQAARKQGLSKSPEYLASPSAGRLDGVRGAACRFQKGHASWNKGTHYVAGGRSAETHFRKGERRGVAVKLWQPVGTERVSKDGYLEVKVNEDLPLQARWRAVHLVRWEAVNGPLPAGHALVFRDGNKANTAPENMELVTRAELMRRNTIHRYAPEVKDAMRLVGRISREVRKQEHEKQD